MWPRRTTLLLDVHDPVSRGGTGRTIDWAAAAPIAARRRTLLAGGLTPDNVAEAVARVRPFGIDVSSGVERSPGVKDHGAPSRAFRGTAMAITRRIAILTARGYFGEFGGRFVPETLVEPVEELERAYFAARDDPAFNAELARLLKHYVGRPTPLSEARRLTAACGGARIFLKREDLTHTGAHKINNALGQALLAVRMGKRRIVAETGAGQHGVATATACALLGLECHVYMGTEDMSRQALNVFRMRLLGAEVLRRRRRQPHAEGRHQRGDARLGHERRATPTICSARCSARIRIR